MVDIKLFHLPDFLASSQVGLPKAIATSGDHWRWYQDGLIAYNLDGVADGPVWYPFGMMIALDQVFRYYPFVAGNSAKTGQNLKKARPVLGSKRLQKPSERQQIPSNAYKSQKVGQIGFSEMSDFAEFHANSWPIQSLRLILGWLFQPINHWMPVKTELSNWLFVLVQFWVRNVRFSRWQTKTMYIYWSIQQSFAQGFAGETVKLTI